MKQQYQVGQSLREHLEMLDLPKLLRQCAGKTNVSEEEIRDFVFELIAYLLTREHKKAPTFKDHDHLFCYLRKAACRGVLKEHRPKRGFNHFELIEESISPEQQLLDELERRSLSEMVQVLHEQAFATEGKRGGKVQQVLSLLIRNPDDYITIRQSGNRSGTYVFNIAQLAKSLGCERKTAKKLIEQTRKILLKRKGGTK